MLVPIVVAASSACLVVLAGNLYTRWRWTRLQRERLGVTYESFRNAFAGTGAAETAISSVHRYIQKWVAIPYFPVLPNDSISNVYGIVDEDVDTVIQDIAEELGCGIPLTYTSEPETVFDLVLLISVNCREVGSAI